jgi:hypothetical protein
VEETDIPVAVDDADWIVISTNAQPQRLCAGEYPKEIRITEIVRD